MWRLTAKNNGIIFTVFFVGACDKTEFPAVARGLTGAAIVDGM